MHVWSIDSTACPSPTLQPTAAETPLPTTSPTATPTWPPVQAPTNAPTMLPTTEPTWVPTAIHTQAPSKLPTLVPCKAIVDGSPSADTTKCALGPYSDFDDEVIYVSTNMAVAGSRCCDNSGNGYSICDFDCEVVDYAVAKHRCEGQGWRLCTAAELLSDLTKGTGCTYNALHVWSSDDCPATLAPVTSN